MSKANNTLRVSRMSISYTQDADSCSMPEDVQDIKVSFDDAGGGPFLIIKTKRWACDNVDELAALLADAVAKRTTGIKWDDE